MIVLFHREVSPFLASTPCYPRHPVLTPTPMYTATKQTRSNGGPPSPFKPAFGTRARREAKAAGKKKNKHKSTLRLSNAPPHPAVPTTLRRVVIVTQTHRTKLQLECRLPWPVSVALPPRSLDKYSRVLGLLLKLEFTTHILEEAHALHRYVCTIAYLTCRGGGARARGFRSRHGVARGG